MLHIPRRARDYLKRRGVANLRKGFDKWQSAERSAQKRRGKRKVQRAQRGITYAKCNAGGERNSLGAFNGGRQFHPCPKHEKRGARAAAPKATTDTSQRGGGGYKRGWELEMPESKTKGTRRTDEVLDISGSRQNLS